MAGFRLFGDGREPVQKSEADEFAEIQAAIKLVRKSVEQTTLDLIDAAIQQNVIKMVDNADNVLGYIVRGTDRDSPLYKTFEQAAALIKNIIRGSIAEGRARAALKAKGDIPYGLGTPLIDDADPFDHLGNPKRRAGRLDNTRLYYNRKVTGVHIDGVVQPMRKSQRRARIT